MALPWEARMRETVEELTGQGYTFPFAWEQALRRHRPSSRDVWGVPPFREPDLLSEPAPEEETVVEFTRRVFEQAFYGQAPILAYFSLDGLVSARDETSSASHQDDFRLAAA